MGADCAVHIIKFLAAHNVTHVTDPFCGKGTVLAAANAFGISAQGVDLSSKQGESAVADVCVSPTHDSFFSQRFAARRSVRPPVSVSLPPSPTNLLSLFEPFLMLQPFFSVSRVHPPKRAGARNLLSEYPGVGWYQRAQPVKD
jgi:hypothetical protein